MAERRINPVYKTINSPLTILGAARDLFFMAAMLGAAVFNLFGSLVGGIVVFTVMHLAARYATQKDPQIIRIFLNSGKFKNQYDPVKFSNEKVVIDA